MRRPRPRVLQPTVSACRRVARLPPRRVATLEAWRGTIRLKAHHARRRRNWCRYAVTGAGAAQVALLHRDIVGVGVGVGVGVVKIDGRK